MKQKKACRNAAGWKCKSDSVEIIDTFVADVLALVLNQTLGRGAEYTAFLVLAQDDLIAIDENFHFVVFCNVQSTS